MLKRVNKSVSEETVLNWRLEHARVIQAFRVPEIYSWGGGRSWKIIKLQKQRTDNNPQVNDSWDKFGIHKTSLLAAAIFHI